MNSSAMFTNGLIRQLFQQLGIERDLFGRLFNTVGTSLLG